MPFVSNVEACASACVKTSQPTRICRQLSGKIHSIAFLACGAALECLGDPAELQALYDAGNLHVFHTVNGSLDEPTENTTESLFNCIQDEVDNYDHPFQVNVPYSLENEAFWADTDKREFSAMYITTQEALVWEVNYRTLSVKDFSDSDAHIVRIQGFVRQSSGVKNWAEAKSPLYDPACADQAV